MRTTSFMRHCHIATGFSRLVNTPSTLFVLPFSLKLHRLTREQDDFRNVLANWHGKWGSINCTSFQPLPHNVLLTSELQGSTNIKCSLLLSYEYLRLYITAFAYQATLSRIRNLPEASGSSSSPSRRSFFAQGLAGTPDARFIYEATSAAKSLLSTFNSFVSPTDCLRYMPIKYYLYIIYAAVFLYKVSSTWRNFGSIWLTQEGARHWCCRRGSQWR